MIRGRAGGAADSGDETPAWNPELGHARPSADSPPLPPRRSKGSVSPSRLAIVAILVIGSLFLLNVAWRGKALRAASQSGAEGQNQEFAPAQALKPAISAQKRLANTQPIVATELARPTRTRVVFTTRFGTFTMEIVPEEDMPLTVGAFMRNIRSGFYTGLVFHRAEPGFLVQAGGRTPANKYRISKNHPVSVKEYKHHNVKYAVAMTSTGQEWFVNMGNNTDWLGPGSKLHGKATSKSTGDPVVAHVVDGFDVLDKVQKLDAKKAGVIRWIEEPVEFEDIQIEGEPRLPRWTGTP